MTSLNTRIPPSVSTSMNQSASSLRYSAAESFEKHLGNPLDPENTMSFKRSIDLDEAEAYPEAACRLLEEWGLHHYYVPAEYGGRLASVEELLALVKVVSRRDFTVAVAHVKTLLGAISIWLGGSATQQSRLSETIRNREQVALALTERNHGGDVLSSEVEAVKVDGGYLLSGEKWLINNATRSTALTVFARTDRIGGPRGFSLLLVEKRDLNPATFICLPKIKTHGIRGADISGISFRKAFIPDNALIGSPGSGLELILKGFQLTRTIVPALSLGAADTALRTTLKFAVSRKLYGRPVFSIAHTRRLLVDAFIDLLIGDCVATTAARALHAAPEQMSLWSAVAKYYVPTMVEDVIKSLGIVLGARHYLREGHDWGVFQKMFRDQAIASVFDGSTIVNLSSVSQQLSKLATNRRRSTSEGNAMSSRLKAIFSLDSPLPHFAPERLELVNRGKDDILQGLDIALDHLASIGSAGSIENSVMTRIVTLTRELVAAVNELDECVKRVAGGAGSPFNQSPELFRLAKRHCQLHAAAACVMLWVHQRADLPAFISSGVWLVLSLDRILKSVQPQREQLDREYREVAAQELCRLYQENRLFALVPFQLAEGMSPTITDSSDYVMQYA
jgi:alkylation response protein AidB-like acyl-CoA dehydrogenase